MVFLTIAFGICVVLAASVEGQGNATTTAYKQQTTTAYKQQTTTANKQQTTTAYKQMTTTQSTCIAWGAPCTGQNKTCCPVPGSTTMPMCDPYSGKCSCWRANTGPCTMGGQCCSGGCTASMCTCGQKGAICSWYMNSTCCSGLYCSGQNVQLGGGNGVCA